MYPMTFDHIHYKSQSFDITKQFYVDVMGATDHGFIELGPEGKRAPNLQLELAGITLFFAEAPEEQTEEPDDCPSPFPCGIPSWKTRHGVYHIAVLVDNCDDATRHFSEKAKEVYGPDAEIVAMEPFMAGDNIRASFLYAPDGMAIELKQNL